MPHLRVLAGPTEHELVPLRVNSGVPVRIASDAFEGAVAVFIKGLADAEGGREDSDYFRKRSGVTWSIQVQGRFLREYSADELLFGNVFERPFKLPWGFGAALKFMNFIDPTLEHDLASRSKPWALSPLVATMPYFRQQRAPRGAPPPPFPPAEPLSDDATQLRTTPSAPAPANPALAKLKASPAKRRSYFANALRRQEVVFGPEDVVTTDFCYDFLQFSHSGIALRLPGGITIDVMKYWDGQPVRFVCCDRARRGAGGGGGERPWGRVLWCVVIEPAEGDMPVQVQEKEKEKAEEEERGSGSDVD
ncbi:hypothetical protein C8Q78DRAFT_1157991 [Trametes maxima]|nr:hypothetical protein C8Q78DRAFT_1157991 [Trametes maxima]